MIALYCYLKATVSEYVYFKYFMTLIFVPRKNVLLIILQNKESWTLKKISIWWFLAEILLATALNPKDKETIKFIAKSAHIFSWNTCVWREECVPAPRMVAADWGCVVVGGRYRWVQTRTGRPVSGDWGKCWSGPQCRPTSSVAYGLDSHSVMRTEKRLVLVFFNLIVILCQTITKCKGYGTLYLKR